MSDDTKARPSEAEPDFAAAEQTARYWLRVEPEGVSTNLARAYLARQTVTEEMVEATAQALADAADVAGSYREQMFNADQRDEMRSRAMPEYRKRARAALTAALEAR